MCGFIGFLHKEKHIPTEEENTRFQYMNDLIFHRGPDDEGFYADEWIQMGFRRLSIIDLESGHQPLMYEKDRYIIIFNGEIYNYVELRAELIAEGMTFQTESDTEVILALYAKKKEEAVKDLRGMFSFVIWDKETKKVFGARDYFGIKPFFYCANEEGLYFASEKKSIVFALEKEQVDSESIQHYFTYQYVPEPATISQNIFKLEPGHYFTKEHGKDMQIQTYWRPKFQPVNIEKQALIQEIREVLYDSVKVHMRSDVPVGSFLSGGIDSSIIASIAKEYHHGIKTFSVGFEQEGFSEVDVAKETAEKLGIENIDVWVTPEQFAAELPKIIWHMDDPMADPAAIPLYFVAQKAAQYVTVVLSGEGADELFGGYNIYHEPFSLQPFSLLPKPFKAVLKGASTLIPQGVKGKSYLERVATPIEQRYYGNAKIFTEEEKQQFIQLYNDKWPYTSITQSLYEQIKDYDDVAKMQFIDMYTWLRGDILVKADKMTMANSLELRVPFLDKEVFRVATKIPTQYKITGGTTKAILREAVRGIVPDHVLDRKKLGFPVPIRHWLKNELHDWVVQLIHESQVDYLINKHYVLDLLADHVANKTDNSRKIWTVLIFMLWHQIYIENVYPLESLQKKKKEIVVG